MTGSPVHISSGAAALAYSLMLGKRRGYAETAGLPFRPHNVTYVVLGTVFLWVGWFGFNGGSALGANLRAVMSLIVTNIAACVGGLTWCLLDYRLERKWSTIGFCSGVIAGLVAITPAAGYVPAWSAIVFGVVGGAACNFATKIKFLIGVDDALDIFAEHAVGGIVGNLLTGLFAALVPFHCPLSHVRSPYQLTRVFRSVTTSPTSTAPSRSPADGSTATTSSWPISWPTPLPASRTPSA